MRRNIENYNMRRNKEKYNMRRNKTPTISNYDMRKTSIMKIHNISIINRFYQTYDKSDF